jgi:hypothetical protein
MPVAELTARHEPGINSQLLHDQLQQDAAAGRSSRGIAHR